MPPEIALERSDRPGLVGWSSTLLRTALAWAVLFAITFREWSEMAHQWWDIDTYSHILLIIPIIGWLGWIRRHELQRVEPKGWLYGVAWTVFGLCCWLAGRQTGINLVAQGGTVMAFQGAAMAIIGLRGTMILAFPLFYMFFLVPFGDEIIPFLQNITAKMATSLTVASGIHTVSDGIHIDTPAGLFIVAEACSGVKFLVAMIALGVLVAYTCFSSWKRRLWFLLACAVVPIIANSIRAWATIFVAQYVGAEAAGSFDHIVYGWIFFAIVIALVLGVAWRWFDRVPEDAGLSLEEVARSQTVSRWEGKGASAGLVVFLLLAVAALFAVIERLV